MTYELTLPVMALVLGGALVNGFHPMLTGTLPLILGSLLGNDLRLHRALRGVAMFVYCLLAELLLVSLALGIALETAPAITVRVVAGGVILIALLELKTAVFPRGIAMQFAESSWRQVRKHAYRAKHPQTLLALNLHLLPYILLFTGASMIGALTLASHTSRDTIFTVACIYSLLLIIPFTLLATLPVRAIRLSALHQWVSRYSPFFHLLQAVVLLVLSWLLFIKANSLEGM